MVERNIIAQKKTIKSGRKIEANNLTKHARQFCNLIQLEHEKCSIFLHEASLG